MIAVVQDPIQKQILNSPDINQLANVSG
jgi:hypothetical protein